MKTVMVPSEAPGGVQVTVVNPGSTNISRTFFYFYLLLYFSFMEKQQQQMITISENVIESKF